MNGGLLPVPDEVKDLSGIPLIKDIDSLIKDNELTYEINAAKVPLSNLIVMSPELDGTQRPAAITKSSKVYATVSVNLEGIKIYAVAQFVNS
jgi:hypothetical protein